MNNLRQFVYMFAAALLLGATLQAHAQYVPTAEQLAKDLANINKILARLASSDTVTLDRNLPNDFAVVTLLRTTEERFAADKHCSLTLESPYWGYLKYSIYTLQKKLGSREDIYAHMVVHSQVEEFIDRYGCASSQVQTSLNNGVRYALDQQDPVAWEISGTKESVFKVGYPFIDYYCSSPGRYDPACAKLIGFIMGWPEGGCSDGLQIPAAPEPPNLLRCFYEMPIDKESRRNFNRAYTFWHKSVPHNLESLHVFGRDQLSSVAPVAFDACPVDMRVAHRAHGGRNRLPVSSYDGGMPEPHPSVRAPHCEPVPVGQLAAAPLDLTEGDYELLQSVAPIYPARALSRGIQGYVDVTFTIAPDGAVENPTVAFSTTSLFERPAIRAVLKYRYKPRVVNGQPVEVTGINTRVAFELE